MLLERINSPSDLKKLSVKDLVALCDEVRSRIIEVVSKTGGHLASSLGAVELAVSLHYCLDTPADKIVWDVGHQAYAHKIITGRNKQFDTLRQWGGISGFPTKEESPYDVFTTGHSSNAISLALGLAASRDLRKVSEKVVAVIGDGSLTGGLSFEALNNAGHLNKDILIVLNTNEMSIAPSIGSLTNYLNKIISQPIYNRFRAALENFIKTRIPSVGSRMLKISTKFEEVLKGLIVPGIFFEELGFRYFGPFDGHDMELLVKTFKNILPLHEPRLVHVITKKGKGYQPAEAAPVQFHGTPTFDVDTGCATRGIPESAPSYTKVFSDAIVELARQDSRVVAITAAMADGTGLDAFAGAYPERFFDVGIAEGHALCFASGLAAGGCKPVVAIYSTFLQRGYDQLIEDIALQKASVILAVDRAGIVGEDGVTHQGVFDIVYLRNIPRMVVMAPRDGAELRAMLLFAVTLDQPAAIRYPRDKAPSMAGKSEIIVLGKSETIREGKDVALFALGSMVCPALAAAGIVSKERIDACVVNARFASPLDEEALRALSKKFRKIIVLEEGIIDGGFGSAVLKKINEICKESERPQVKLIGLATEFIPHARRAVLLEKYGLSAEALAQSIREFVKD